MKSCVVASALLLGLLAPSTGQAQSRVSIEVGGAVSAYDVNTANAGVARGAIRVPDSSVAGAVATGPSGPVDGIAMFEVRPTVLLDDGLLIGVGFRAGKAGLDEGGTALVGGDVALGFQHRWGPFVPFIKGMFGFNSYELAGSGYSAQQTDLRIDAVVGSRLYVSRRLFLAAAAFAGWGDRYGGTVSIGADLVQVFHRGRMP